MTDLVEETKEILIEQSNLVLYRQLIDHFGSAGESFVEEIKKDKERLRTMSEEIAELRRQIAFYRGHNRRQGEKE